MGAYASCLEELMTTAGQQGYLTYDDIMNITDAFNLSVGELDSITEAIQIRGVIIYEEAPKQQENPDDQFDDYSRVDYDAIFDEVIELCEDLKPLIEEIRRIPAPQWGETSILCAQVREGNSFAKDRLINMNLRTVIKTALNLAKQYGFSIDDCIANGFAGLITAVENYDPSGFSNFQSYSSNWVRQIIQRECVPGWQKVYYPTHVKEKIYPIYAQYMYWDKYIGGNKGAEEYISETLELSKEEVMKYLRIAIAQDEASFGIDGIDEMDDVMDPGLVVSEDEMFQTVHKSYSRSVILEVLQSLTDREREVLQLRNGLITGNPLTLDEIGQLYGVTRERVRQIETKAIRKCLHPTRQRKLKELLE